MLALKLLRETPEIIEGDLKKRGDAEKLKWVKIIKELDQKWKLVKQQGDKLRQERNSLSQKINEGKKAGKSVRELLKKAKAIPGKIEKEEEKAGKLRKEIDHYLMKLPNILDCSVPKGRDGTENVEVRKQGKPAGFSFPVRNHVELLESLNLADFERSAKISGSGFYFLKGDVVLLEQALIRFALEVIRSKGYLPVSPPLMMRRQAYEGVTDLSDFETMMYKIDGEDEYLIATSEHPLTAMHTNEALELSQLPLKYVGISSCFRKEIGSHGIDEKGLFRTHQFNKVEQIIICRPEDSGKFHEELINNIEEIFKALGLPSRVVNICTGDIGTVAAKKYDLETWLPHQGKYREMGSCSNCTDYQARRLRIKFRDRDGKMKYVHTLNSTAVAVGRAIVAILENFQTKEGMVKIPPVLWPYMAGVKELGKT